VELTSDDAELTPEARVGARIRRLREARNLSIRGLSEQVSGYSHSYLGRVELGKQRPSKALITALDDFFETDGALAEIYGVAQDALIARYGREFTRKEREAARIEVFTSSLIPGLLQTEDYARELFRSGLLAQTEASLTARVAKRIERQEVLTRPDPPYYWAVMDEAALRRPADGALMRHQLAHVLSKASLPHVTVQVLPFTAGMHSMMGGSLTIVTLPDGRSSAFAESFDSGDEVDYPKRLIELRQRFTSVCAAALPERESAELIREYLREYE
jgi:transcriptional regulator with XRE-family HTH domain